ncbi:MAG: NADH-quinone oxidoreductase subunit C [Spirochaetes bacterium]|nr:NADH-quinone oxidoreductase subunit C [Spirochaetota bacterium]MBL7006747.1 NADH-quinone oxidoreductase subunit C [Spirochaetia bacterium]
MKQTDAAFAVVANNCTIPVSDIPLHPFVVFERLILDAVAADQRVSALFGVVSQKSGKLELYVVLSDDAQNQINICRAEVSGSGYPSLTPKIPQAHLFEREIAEQFGILPEGHPWLKPVRYCASWSGKDAWNRTADEPIVPAVTDFYRVEGEQIHEVAVGPVHAGVIEPGHFRFQCHGELMYHVEIALGYQYRGIEEAMLGERKNRNIHYIETAAGDTTVGHTITYCQIIEALSHTQKPARAQVIRGIALELERIANHIGDLGALAGDVGYLPTSSFCGRIRGDFLNITALICGNRFGRGLVVPGGTGYDLDDSMISEILTRLAVLHQEARDAVNLLWITPSVMARFEDTGILTNEFAIKMGITGPAARAAGVGRDIRYDQPSGVYRFSQVPVSTCESGDVFARAFVRWMEIEQSLEFITAQLKALSKGSIRVAYGKLEPESLSLALNEGWRGEICHVAITNTDGGFARYKIVDPSFHNWIGLAQVLRNEEISDFPLCNKSFNLSYCGHDL